MRIHYYYKIIIRILAALLLLSGIFTVYIQKNFHPLTKEIPKYTELFDSQWTRIGEILPKEKIRYSPIIQVPKISEKTLLALEDKTFYSHFWISIRWIVRSIYFNIQSGEAQYGGSTITMGLARNLLGINRERTMFAKMEEVIYAILLEIRYSKKEILTAYFDRAHFGRNSRWIEAASQSYFWKPLQNLGDYENIALVTLMKNPSKYDPIKEPEAFKERFERVLKTAMIERIIKEEITFYDLSLSESLKNDFWLDWKGSDEWLPYVVDAWKKMDNDGKSNLSPQDSQQGLQQKSQKITTTIDRGLTKKVETIADGVLFNLAKRNVQDYGVLVVDRKTHGVRVLIGGKNYQWEAGQVSSIFSARQIGSTIKPFTYSLAIEKGITKTSDFIQDLPVTFLTAEGNPYEPKNYSRTFQGKITVGQALAGSVNVPAILLTEQVSTKELLAFLQSIGITSLIEWPDHYGLALGLWVGEVSLWELTQAYTLWSDGGKFCEFTLDMEVARKGTSCKQILSKNTIDQIVQSLSSQDIKSQEFPYGSTLDFGEGKVFVKTGTSRNFRDNYAIGFTHDFLIGVWTGNKDGENMRGVTGASGAGEIFAGIIQELGGEKLITDPISTESISHIQSDIRKSWISWNIGWSHEKTLYKNLKITNPTDQSQYTTKKWVPSEKQVIKIEYWSEKSLNSVSYWLDGKKLESPFIEIVPLSWGNHEVRVNGIDKNGEKMDDVSWFLKKE